MQQQDYTILNLLQNIANKDNELRKKSEKKLFQLSYINPFEFIKQITVQLTNENGDEHIRFLSGLMFTMITTKPDPQTKLTAWERITPEERKVVQQGILQALATQSHQVRKGASNAVAKVARNALKTGEWDDLVPTLIQGMEHEKKDYKLSCMLAVGKICQDARSSSIQKDQAKQLFTVLLKQMQVDDEKLHSYGLQSILVMIPFAGGLLENDQQFAMLLSDQIMNFINAENLSLKLQERAWRCMNEICHFFYTTLHNKYEYLITKVFQILSTDLESDIFESLAVISVQTLSSIIIQQFERSRRKLFTHNMIMPISQKLASELIKMLRILSQKSSQIDELTNGIFPAVEESLEKLMQLADKAIIPIIEQQIEILFDKDDTKCAGITVAACYFSSSDTEATRTFLEKGFGVFIDLLAMNKIFVVERMVKLFEAAVQQHYQVLVLDADYRKKLLECILDVDQEKDFDIALLKMKLLLKFSTISNNFNLPTNSSSIQIMETCYKIILTGQFEKNQYELPHRASLTFQKAAGTIQDQTQQYQILRDTIFIMMCSDISDKIQKLSKLSECENKALDFLFEMTGQVLLTLQRIQFKHLNVLVGFIFTVFEHRKSIGAQACGLLTGLITAGEGLEMKQIMVSAIPYISYVLTCGAQNKVITDVLLTISSIAMVVRHDVYQFFSFLDPIGKILQETSEHGILYLGIQVYSDYAFYSGSMFKPHVERFLEVLDNISRKIISYWEEKQIDGRMDIFQFDQDDKACIRLTEGLIDSYHNCIIGSDQGKWKVKVVNYGNSIVQFLEQVILKMVNVISIDLLMEIGYTFVDFLRVLKQSVYPWYKEKGQFFQTFVCHMINEGKRMKEKSLKGEMMMPNQQNFEEVIKCGFSIGEWFKKFSIDVQVPE